MSLYPEQVSPNVSYINNNALNTFLASCGYNDLWASSRTSIKCHKNNIFEIDVQPFMTKFTDGLYDAVKRQFDTYAINGHLYPVSTSGLKDVGAGIGSYRHCTMNPVLAQFLTDTIKGRSIVDYYSDWQGDWKFANVSQYFRFMQYTHGGEHFPHYDSDFFYNRHTENAATKFSLVMYFTDCESGEFAFVNDNRQDHGNSDWNRQATDDEIYLKIKPRAGKILLFPHNLCHTVLPYTDEEGTRTIVRGDILFYGDF